MNPQSFLNKLQSKQYSIPIEANYSVIIYDFGRIAKNLTTNQDIITDKKIEEYTFWPDIEEEMFLATSINLPGENMASGRVGYTGENTVYGGLLSGPVLKGRQNLTNLDITLIETTDSFVDYFMRPWVIAASQFGLFTKRDQNSSQNFKTKIEILFYDKLSSDGIGIRKRLLFNDAVPLEVGGYEASYGKTVGMRTTKTSWIYSTYEIK